MINYFDKNNDTVTKKENTALAMRNFTIKVTDTPFYSLIT